MHRSTPGAITKALLPYIQVCLLERVRTACAKHARAQSDHLPLQIWERALRPFAPDSRTLIELASRARALFVELELEGGGK